MSEDTLKDQQKRPEDYEVLSLTTGPEADGKRLDQFLGEVISDMTRSRIKALIKEGFVRVDGEIPKPSLKLKRGISIAIELKPPKQINADPENIPIDILYQDHDICVVNKPQGMVVHPAAGSPDGTLVNALLYHVKDLSGIGGEFRPGIVHRIDKDTSGVLVTAKTDIAHQGLSELFKNHDIDREYIALVKGIVKEDSGTIDKPIGRDPKDRKKMTVTDKNSRNAVTHFEVLERYKEGYTLMRFKLETGRTHQIRVHMAKSDHPIAGDPVYGGDKKNPFNTNGQLLHARKLGFIHPVSGEFLTFETPVPSTFKLILKKLHPLDSFNIDTI